MDPHRRLFRLDSAILYDLRSGPPPPRCMGPCPLTEWDDPTFVTVTVDEEWMEIQQSWADPRRPEDRIGDARPRANPFHSGTTNPGSERSRRYRARKAAEAKSGDDG